uniref:Uncharacterized protein n=1 Tax=Strix occidentalis caurina TaxID=311401 RepID=A0A8D0F662_STROC
TPCVTQAGCQLEGRISTTGSTALFSQPSLRTLTCIEDSFQCLDVSGDARDPVDANFFDAPLLHLLDALAHDVRHLGALAPASESGTINKDF